MNSLQNYISEQAELFSAGCNTDNISDPPNDTDWIKSLLSSSIREAYLLGIEEVKDYIEAECEWVKEDVPDGNDGYFKVRGTDLSRLETLSREISSNEQ